MEDLSFNGEFDISGFEKNYVNLFHNFQMGNYLVSSLRGDPFNLFQIQELIFKAEIIFFLLSILLICVEVRN